MKFDSEILILYLMFLNLIADSELSDSYWLSKNKTVFYHSLKYESNFKKILMASEEYLLEDYNFKILEASVFPVSLLFIPIIKENVQVREKIQSEII